jgi:hypothetical protein
MRAVSETGSQRQPARWRRAVRLARWRLAVRLARWRLPVRLARWRLTARLARWRLPVRLARWRLTARLARWRPAIGPNDWLPRRVRLRRGTVALALILLLVLAKVLVSQGIIKIISTTPPLDTVAAGLLVGGAPSDSDLLLMTTDFRVGGIVNLTGPNVAEQVTAASLHQGYLYLPLLPDKAPTWAQLRVLASFMRAHTAGGASVYVHDDVGGGRAVTTAAMLLLLRGQTWPAVSAEITPAEFGSMSTYQQLAIRRLRSALHPNGHSSAGNPYAAARLDPW